MRAKQFLPVLGAMVVLMAPTAALADEDIKAFYAEKCEVCHSLGGKGGKMAAVGGAIDGVGSTRDAEWMRTYLVTPKTVMPAAKMPVIKMTPEQLDAMIAYMMSLK
jgi:mono/diheme cytochrome c family protein